MDAFSDAAERFTEGDAPIDRIDGAPRMYRSRQGHASLVGRAVRVTAIDGGLAVLARRSNAAFGVVKVSQVTASHPGIEASTQRWVVTVIASEDYEVSMTDLASGRTRSAMLARTDASGIEREPERGLELARALLEREVQAAASGFVLADGSLAAKMPEERDACARLPDTVIGIVKRSSIARSGASPETLVAASFSEPVFAHPLERAYYCRLHPLGPIVRVEGDLDDDRFDTLLSASCDAAVPGYPYSLVLADRFARISNREARALALEAASRFGIPIGSLHDVLDSLEH